MLTYLVAQRLQGLKLIPPGVKVERDRRSCWIGYYTFSKINAETLPLTDVDYMQYGCALDQLLK